MGYFWSGMDESERENRAEVSSIRVKNNDILISAGHPQPQRGGGEGRDRRQQRSRSRSKSWLAFDGITVEMLTYGRGNII